MTVPHVLRNSTSSSFSVQAPDSLQDEVARRAYVKWTSRSQGCDRQLQDWLEAEAELALEAAISGRMTEAKERLFGLLLERGEAQRRLVAEHSVSSILAVAETLADAAPKLAQAICECLGWDVGVVWLLDRSANLLRCLEIWHPPHIQIPAFEHDARLRTFSAGIGLPGRVWTDGSIVWMPDVTADANFTRGEIAAKEGLRGAIGFPVHNGVEFLSVLEFFSREVRQPDEQVTEMMNRIAGQISQFIERRSVERQLHRQEDDRRIGREIQQSLLPKTMPRLPGFEISGRSLAPNSVGGDCFDFIPMPGGGRDCLGILVADASGHGIGAALLTGQTRAFLRGLALTCTDVGPLLDLTNQSLSNELMSDHFVTAFVMRLDPRSRSLNYASAGHLPGYVLDQQGRTKAVLPSSGLPLGIDPANKFPASTVFLDPGDLVLLITDGIIEAVSPNDELFGMERTLRLVRQHLSESPDAILMTLFNAVGEFCNNKRDDDLTAVIIKVNNGD